MTRSDLKQLTRIRLREARALLSTRNYCGAYYLAGYAIECALKACIAKQTKQFEFPDKQRAANAFEHLPGKLIRAAGIYDEWQLELKRDKAFAKNWSTIEQWGVEKRYEIKGAAQEVIELLAAIEDPDHGVLQWLRNYW